MAGFTQKHGTLILVVTAVFAVGIVLGVSRLRVENSFIDYFKSSTEIHQGMTVMDQKLGGTTPVDVVVRFGDLDLDADADTEKEASEKDAFEDFEDDPFDDMIKEDPDQYWFTNERLAVVEKVHRYLDQLPETGKVLSLGTLLEIGRNLNSGKSLDSLDMAVFYKKLPAKK